MNQQGLARQVMIKQACATCKSHLPLCIGLFSHTHQRHCHWNLQCHISIYEIHLETQSRLTVRRELTCSTTQRVQGLSASRDFRQIRVWKWWASRTNYLVCVNSLSKFKHEQAICPPSAIFAHHMMYFWGLCLHWTTQPICEAKWEQIMMATVPIRLGFFFGVY